MTSGIAINKEPVAHCRASQSEDGINQICMAMLVSKSVMARGYMPDLIASNQMF